MAERQPTRRYLEILGTSVHRSRRNILFLNDCVSKRIFPKHTYIPAKVLQYVCWSKSRVLREREKILNKSLGECRDKLKEKEILFESNSSNSVC